MAALIGAAVLGGGIWPAMYFLVAPHPLNIVWMLLPPIVISLWLSNEIGTRVLSYLLLMPFYNVAGVLSFFFVWGYDY